MKKWDVIIVGAGPAGIAAAMAVARSGGRPLLIDRKKFPRPKACAGMLTPNAVTSAPFNLGPVICSASNQVEWVESGSTKIYQAKNLLSHRIELDNYLFNQAIAAGISFKQVPAIAKILSSKDGIRLTTNQMALFTATYLIAADGANSTVRKLTGLALPSPAAFAVEVDITLKNEQIDTTAIFDFAATSGGYAWMFPKGKTGNAGIAIMSSTTKGIIKKLGSYLEGLKTTPSLKKIQGASIGSYGAGTYLGDGKILFCGDAARLADPLTGEGISMAFKSGHAAGTAVMRYQQEQQLQQLQQQSPHVKSALLHYQEMLSPLLDQLKKRQQQATPMSYGSTT